MPGVVFWTGWIALTPEAVADLSDITGVYEVKVEKRLVDYPGGRSAMIYYGATDAGSPSLRAVVARDWFAPDKQAILTNWAQYGMLVFRWAALEAPFVEDEHARRRKQFVERFGRAPWGNPDA